MNLFFIHLIALCLFLASNCWGGELIPKGQPVDFDYTGHVKERKIVRKLYKEDIDSVEEITGSPVDIGIFTYDLNEDGQKEILFILTGSGFCGVSHCTFSILQKNNNKWLAIFDVATYPDGTIILPQLTNHYHLLAFPGSLTLPGYNIWQWNGKTYDYKEKLKEK